MLHTRSAEAKTSSRVIHSPLDCYLKTKLFSPATSNIENSQYISNFGNIIFRNIISNRNSSLPCSLACRNSPGKSNAQILIEISHTLSLFHPPLSICSRGSREQNGRVPSRPQLLHRRSSICICHSRTGEYIVHWASHYLNHVRQNSRNDLQKNAKKFQSPFCSKFNDNKCKYFRI